MLCFYCHIPTLSNYGYPAIHSYSSLLNSGFYAVFHQRRTKKVMLHQTEAVPRHQSSLRLGGTGMVETWYFCWHPFSMTFSWCNIKITPSISGRFIPRKKTMVYETKKIMSLYHYSCHGVYKSTCNWGAPHCSWYEIMRKQIGMGMGRNPMQWWTMVNPNVVNWHRPWKSPVFSGSHLQTPIWQGLC